MIKKVIHKILLKRHFWRYATFGELFELYTSNMLRAIAENIFSIFLPVYLLKTGYSVSSICFYMIVYFVVRFFGDLITGYTVARIGPKHSWIISHASNIFNLLCLLALPNHAILLWFSAIFNALGTSFQLIPLHVNFSKIKHIEHNGKELGFFMILEKVGLSVGPMLGGYIAAVYGANYTIITSIIIYLGSLIPLLMTPEPVRTRQKITFRGFPLMAVWRDIASNSIRAIDATVTRTMWPIYMALAVFGKRAYEEIGLVSTLSTIVVIGSVFIVGKIIDNKHALRFFRFSVILNSLTHLARIFTSNLAGILAVNSINEVATNGITMSWIKGAYDAVEDLPGYRIIYFMIIEMTGHLGKILIWLLLAVLTNYITEIHSLKIVFVVSAVLSLFIMIEKFKVLRPGFFARLIQ